MNRLFGFLILLTGFNAEAGFLLEPFVGYDQTAATVTNTGGTDVGYKSTGTSYGARVGYHSVQGFLLAGEYTASTGTAKSNVTGAADSAATRSVTGAVLGYDRNKFRVWVGYGMTDKMTLTPTGGTGVDYKGTNYKIGMGFRAANSVALNVEYIVPKYTTFNSGTTDADITTGFTKYDTAITSVSLSFPLDLGNR